jgi:predicted nucleic acid-binding protein
MAEHLVDTGPLAGYLLGRRWAIETLDPLLDKHEAATSILVNGEAIGYLKSLTDYAARRRQLRRQLQEIRPYLLTYGVLERFADIRRALLPPYGTGLIGDVDTLIAATALAYDLTVVTVDRDFTRVPQLRVRVLARDTARWSVPLARGGFARNLLFGYIPIALSARNSAFLEEAAEILILAQGGTLTDCAVNEAPSLCHRHGLDQRDRVIV